MKQWKNQIANLKADTENPVGSVLSELTDTEMEMISGGIGAYGFTDGDCIRTITAGCDTVCYIKGCF
ncbi:MULTISPECIES: hypothetical protein [Paenibacillus]|jgi:hypothetical protein|uniref:hypothetical protein n=1 Tax=Paenibacillus TaxID=44249 RepID=UPI00083D741C|nr:hypothetical protein [Paenibacillus polymyxa]APQ59184.1 hypothetical protein VK72_10710 [Paenibacillus polymyxa]ODB60575.1 hypothetical protein A7309_17285 [Paenibacillus polymyxa]